MVGECDEDGGDGVEDDISAIQNLYSFNGGACSLVQCLSIWCSVCLHGAVSVYGAVSVNGAVSVHASMVQFLPLQYLWHGVQCSAVHVALLTMMAAVFASTSDSKCARSIDQPFSGKHRYDLNDDVIEHGAVWCRAGWLHNLWMRSAERKGGRTAFSRG